MLARSPFFRLLVLVVIAACWSTPTFAQEDPAFTEDLPTLSLQRLTVGVTSSFFYAPWNDLNDSFGAVRDAYAYNAVLGLERGSIDRHRGDMSAGIDLTYRIVGPISLTIEGALTSTKAEMQLTANPTSYTYYGVFGRSKYHNSFDLGLAGFGGGLVIDLPGTLHTRLRITAGRSEATLEYAFSSTSDNEIGRFNATLRDVSTYITIGLESSIPIAGPLSFFLGAQFRSLGFANLRGDGTAFHDYPSTPGYAVEIPMRARLVRAGSYYGVDGNGDWRVEDVERLMLEPWAATSNLSVFSSLQRDAVPATLYLNGFGIRGGLTYAF
jgi:hypothetical protein